MKKLTEAERNQKTPKNDFQKDVALFGPTVWSF